MESAVTEARHDGLAADPDFTALARPDDETRHVAGQIVASYAAAIVALAGQSARPEWPSLWSYVEAGLDKLTDLSSAWIYPVGALHEALARGAGLEAALIELALEFTASGFCGQWEIDTGQEQSWRLGHYLLPAAARLRVEIDGGIIAIDLAHEAVRFRARQPGEGIDPLGPPPVAVIELDQVGFAGAAPFATICPGAGRFLFGDGVEELLMTAPLPRDFSTLVELSLAQVYAGAPTYKNWVRDSVKVIVPCRSDPETLSSGSSSRMPGVIRITADQRPEALVEMIVHEASHQYLYIAGFLGEFADPDDARLFWSPAKQAPRPIDRILLAYHAFANVEMVFASCLAHDIGNRNYYAFQYERLVKDLDLMERHLLGCGSLTPLGLALCLPLIERRGRQ